MYNKYFFVFRDENSEDEDSEEIDEDRNRVQNFQYSTIKRGRPELNEVTTSK